MAVEKDYKCSFPYLCAAPTSWYLGIAAGLEMMFPLMEPLVQPFVHIYARMQNNLQFLVQFQKKPTPLRIPKTSKNPHKIMFY
jgi:hypothetical protein